MGLRHTADDEEPETARPGAAGVLASHEGIEDGLTLALSDARPAIGHADLHLTVVGRDAHGHRLAAHGVRERVPDQVGDGRPHLDGVDRRDQ